MEEKIHLKNEWQRVTKFYEQVDGEGKNKVEANLARKLAESEYASAFYPYTSHRALCISPSTDFFEMHKFPMISILHLGNKRFRVEYWEQQWKERDRQSHEVEDAQLWNLLESLLLRMQIESSSS